LLPELVRERRFDAAHVMLGSLARVPLGGVPAVLAPLDAWHLNVRAEAERATGPERAWRLAQERAVRRWEAREYRRFARVVLVTEEDAAEVRRLDPAVRTAVIPNGVDAAWFAPPVPASPGLGVPGPAAAPSSPGSGTAWPARAGVLFTGALDAPANVQAALRLARRIMPLVHRELPDTPLAVVGRAPSGELHDALGPALVGEVPDLRPHLWGAAVYACPMEQGTGIKNKLLEAMAAGAPAVATPLACQGLDPTQVRLGRSDEELAAGIVALLRDPAQAAAQADAARRYVRDHRSWDAVADAYLALYEEIAGA
jgi:polysaccharide biosynthesis protein PslH